MRVLTEDEIKRNVSENVKFLIWQKGIASQKEFALTTEVATAQISRMVNGELIPSVSPFLMKIREKFDVSIDDFLCKNLRKEYENKIGVQTNIPVTTFTKYLGLYQMYYYDTSSYKGRERADDVKALKSGLLLIQEEPNSENEFCVTAVFNMKKEYADNCFANAKKFSVGESLENIRSYLTNFGGSNHVYHGRFTLSTKHFYINLNFEGTKDKVQMIFHCPDSSKDEYIGGLGTMVSVSKGRKSSPCLQYIALTDVSLAASEEEIASHMLMHYGNIKTYESADELVEMLIQLYQDEDGKRSRLTDEQKKTLVKNHIDKVVNDTVEKNLFRCVVVSEIDDDEFYHYIKNVKKHMREEGIM